MAFSRAFRKSRSFKTCLIYLFLTIVPGQLVVSYALDTLGLSTKEGIGIAIGILMIGVLLGVWGKLVVNHLRTDIIKEAKNISMEGAA